MLGYLGLAWAAACGGGDSAPEEVAGDIGENPILFVTQFPIPDSFTTIGGTFGNHQTSMQKVGRGGDLWIRYPDGQLKNLTEAAGFGAVGFQGADSIAVREPQPHWDGEHAVFSMVIGAPAARFDTIRVYWQLYEITGLGQGETPVITKVANQPEDANNIGPSYATDDQILFVTDRALGGARHLYPQRDEYEMATSTSGVWKLNPTTGDLVMLNHTPSGAFSPRVDSFGRVIFIRWDHLQRDLLSDGDAEPTDKNGTFDYVDESASGAIAPARVEIFPEPRPPRTDLLAGTNLRGHTFNLFFPWMMNEDGTEEETLNHIGRHELRGYIDGSINGDENIGEFIDAASGRVNDHAILNFFHIAEDPSTPGRYFGTDAVEFGANTAGQMIALNLAPGVAPDSTELEYITRRATRSGEMESSGKYRNPLPLTSGMIVAAHADSSRLDDNEGTRARPQARYKFRLRTMRADGDFMVADKFLTPGIEKEITYFDPDEEVSYSGPMWELDPVELRARPRPEPMRSVLPAPEAAVFAQTGVDPATFSSYLAARDLAVIVSRNVTSRDVLDTQQPYNLRVPGGVETISDSGAAYDVSHLQFFQADMLRGQGGSDDPDPGRRALARILHVPAALAENEATAIEGAVALGTDGSVAAFVPAGRALTWQLTDAAGAGVVRERYWLTFRPGEVRVCASCHGLSSGDQLGRQEPTNEPEALRQLLTNWAARQRALR